MTRLIRAELLHLRSLRSTWFTAAAVVGLATLIVGADLGDTGAGAPDTPAERLESFMATLTLLPAIGLGLFAAASAAAEFRHGTIVHRALAAPRRWRILAARLLVMIPLALLVTAAALLGGVLAASGSGPAPPLDGVAVAEVLAGPALFAGLGVAVGFLARNQTAAVLVVFGGWVLEKLIAAVTGPPTFLPYGLLDGLAGGEALAGIALALLTSAVVAAAGIGLSRGDAL